VRHRAETLLLLGLVGQYPMAGIAWQAIHHLLGFRALGWDAWYVEDSGAVPYDPRVGGVTGKVDFAVRYLGDVMTRAGFGDRWAYVDLVRGETHGRSRAELRALYRRATAIVNLCGATAPREEHRQGGRLIYVETDPVYEQLAVAAGSSTSLGFLAAHDVLFTYGENLGRPECPVPTGPFVWHATRPPVMLSQWRQLVGSSARYFTTVASFASRGKDIVWQGQPYRWSKDENFRRVLELPRHTSQPLRLAAQPPAGMAARFRRAGWDLVDPTAISRDLDTYRRFVQASRGEFTVAKDIYVRSRSGWFSDRSVCYLAAGRPVVTQDTGFGTVVPTGEGLFAFATLAEAVEALARVNADYAHHSRAAFAIAAEYFAAERVLGRLLAEAGLG